MSEFIERKAALASIRHEDPAFSYAVERVPAADVRPVVRGEWKEWWPGDCALIMTGEEMLWACSECGSKYSEKQNYCPNCGADMREES